MATRVGVGFSDQRNPLEAGEEAARRALEQAGVPRPDFVLVFATVGYRPEPLLRAIRQITSQAPLCGCSGEGVITRAVVSETNFGVAVMVFSSDELRFEHALVDGLEQGADRAGSRLAAEIAPFLAPDNLAGLLFADGLAFNFDPFRRAFEQALPRPLPLFGGLAADNWVAQQTFQYHDDRIVTGGIACVVISGQGELAWGVDHGCVPVGTRRSVTRSRANVIQEIDGTPALETFQDYFEADWRSQWNKTSLNLCLGLRAPEQIRGEYGQHIIRYMMAKDDQAGEVEIQSDIPVGTELWLMRRDKELIRGGLQGIAERIRSAQGDRPPRFILQFECVGRGKVVFRDQEKLEMIRSLQDDLGADIPWLGFYGYGEIGPIGQANTLHNFTSVILAVS